MSPRNGQLLVLLVDPDPYLAYLLHSELRGARVVEVADAAEIDESADLAIVELRETGTPRPRATKVLGVAAGSSMPAAPPGFDGVLLRPFDPAEVRRTVRRLIGLREPATPGAKLHTLRCSISFARALAAAVAAVLELAVPHSSSRPALFAALVFVYAGVTMFPHRTGRLRSWLDVCFASVLMAATGGVTSSYTALALVVAADAGLVLGPAVGAGAAAGLVFPSLASLYPSVEAGVVGTQTALSWLAVFPLVALLAGMLVRMLGGASDARRLAAEANRVLSVLFRLTRSMPSGLDARTVAGACMDELRESHRVPAAVLLSPGTGGPMVAASYGIDAHELAPEELLWLPAEPQAIRSSTLPPALRRHACWLVVPVAPSGQGGHIVAACPDCGRHPQRLVALRHLADETAIGMENARLFAGVRAMSADAERQRLARELHDGVVQSLAFVRMELEFLSRHPSAKRQSGAEAARLARVVGQATDEIRSTIDEMRSSESADELTDALRAYLRDVNGVGGPRIDFESHGRPDLTRAHTGEVFRIVQEAVSNAVRHAGASVVTVSVDAGPRELRVRVRDDGRGVVPAPATATGMGLSSMRERAKRLGASLSVRPDARGGTVVELAKVSHEAVVA